MALSWMALALQQFRQMCLLTAIASLTYFIGKISDFRFQISDHLGIRDSDLGIQISMRRDVLSLRVSSMRIAIATPISLSSLMLRLSFPRG